MEKERLTADQVQELAEKMHKEGKITSRLFQIGLAIRIQREQLMDALRTAKVGLSDFTAMHLRLATNKIRNLPNGNNDYEIVMPFRDIMEETLTNMTRYVIETGNKYQHGGQVA